MNKGTFFFKKRAASRSPFVIERFRKAKFLATAVSASLLYQIIFPNICWGLTGGPANPDFANFEPVATTNMVNEFSGQFVYNLPVIEIPGASGAGYALSLSYHSGDGPEAEASWVGYGWSLNPGSINRSKRGLPDDYKNAKVRYRNNVPKNWTIAATGQVSGEVFSGVGGSANATMRYNNYKGFGYSEGIGMSVLSGSFSLGLEVNDGDATFSVGVNPAALLGLLSNKQKSDNLATGSQNGKAHDKIEKTSSVSRIIGTASDIITQTSKIFAPGLLSSGTSKYINYLLTDMSSPYNVTPYNGFKITGSVSITGDPAPFPVGVDGSVDVSYSQQENVGDRSVSSYGYMYSGNAPDNNSTANEVIMDYTLEHASTFNQRDKYLPVPYNTADAYFVSGEGVSGSFRMYNDRCGIFSPNYTASTTSSLFFGADVHLGTDFGLGGDISSGESSLTVMSKWSGGDDGNTDSFWFVPYGFRDTTHQIYEGSFFRFNNDLGGKVIYDNSDKPEAAIINGTSPTLPSTQQLLQGGNINKIPDIGTNTFERRNGRASYIGYHTNKEINTINYIGSPNNITDAPESQYASSSNGNYYIIRSLAYEKNARINRQAGRDYGVNSSKLNDAIGEIAIVNESGNQYVYGLPVYTDSEKSLQYGLTNVTNRDNYIVTSNISNNENVIGQEYKIPYASSYLLTQITTPDYVDINQNGPDDTDYGGYTRFTYHRATNNIGHSQDDKVHTNGWYQWRVPYMGLYYHPNKFSSNEDDMGSYEFGYKEIYYLDTIITKTHYAVFITDTNRTDGIDASDEYSAASGTTGTSHKQGMLTKILLYAKSTHGTPDQLIKTVHFDYSNECWPGIPNSSSNTLGNNGKLTLKRVWFEYNGVVNAYISPYVFQYSYPHVSYPSQYAYIANEMSSYDSSSQSPSYSPYIDCWGNYQDSGYTRRNLFQCWHSQNPGNEYDPAAWQLKRIILPSGGEIHIQYEENTYSYVQDRQACALVKLSGSIDGSASSFLLNVNHDLGISSTTDLLALRDLINRTYKDKKIYFKFFYTLIGTSFSSAANLGDCNGDYIEGYANFNNADTSGGYIRIDISNDQLPRQVCLDYIKHEVGGKLLNGDCTSSTASALNDPGNAVDEIVNIGKQLLFSAISNLTFGAFNCLKINPEVSYFRIPILKKRGGGIRVKRLLMYNKDIDINHPGLYGTEYIYDNTSDGTSYGVATNEPSENKGENPLVDYLQKRGDQSWTNKLIAGKDKEQFEGPIGGFSSLPSASIGYSRIIKKNIAQTKDVGTGYTVIDYYTAKDYPFDRYYPEIDAKGADNTDIQTVQDAWNVDIGLLSYCINTGIRSSQGYCFIQNQMHGQLRSLASYPGFYDPVKFYSTTNPPTPVTQQVNTYFEPGEKIPMYDFNTWSIKYDQPGKEMDVTIDRRSVDEESSETRVTADGTLGVFIFFALPYIIGFPISSGSKSRMNTIVLNKTIHYPAILKSVQTMKDGFVQKADNIAFDPLTTKPVLTRTYDGYNSLLLQDAPTKPHTGAYTTYNIPASSQTWSSAASDSPTYYHMGQRAWNERYSFCSGANDYIHVNGIYGSPFQWQIAQLGNQIKVFKPGDLIGLFYTGGGVDMAHVTSVDLLSQVVSISPAVSYGTSSLDTSGNYNKVEIIHSGYTNQLASSAGSFTEYGYPDTCSIRAVRYISPIGPDEVQDYVPPVYYHHQCIFITKASNTIYSDSFAYSYSNTPPSNNYNPYESGQKGKWRPYQNYVYRDTTIFGSNMSAGQRSYKFSGTTSFGLYQGVPYSRYISYNGSVAWDTTAFGRYYYLLDNVLFPGKWVLSNQLLQYSQDGNATEEMDIDNVHSTAKYGYRGILPYLVAQNCNYSSAHFESFENIYNGNQLEDGMLASNPAHITSTAAHTGKYSYRLYPSDSIRIPTTTDPVQKGLLIRFWAQTTGSLASKFSITVNNLVTIPTTYVGRSGDWALYEARWTSSPHTATFTLRNYGTAPYLIDDIRIQPFESKVMAYVYDIATYRLAAVMDDQNFATYYQYDGEGKLVRKLYETQRGIRTAEEAEYHTPTVKK